MFSSDYLRTVIAPLKWCREDRNFAVGDAVLVAKGISVRFHKFPQRRVARFFSRNVAFYGNGMLF